MARVKISNLTKTFGEVVALDDVNFETNEGEFFFILGPSGAGKSTLFNLISGILPATRGEISIGDRVVNKLPPRERNVAIAFESYALYPNRTVYGNIRFPLDAPIRKNDLSEQEKDRMVREMAGLLQIGELLDRLPRELSGGQRQRVALGRTLIRRPNVYLLDEPIAHLDAKLRHQMRRELKRLQRELGIPAIFSTPDQSEAVAMADRIAVLNKGKVQQIGTPEDLYLRPANTFVAGTLGDPKIVFVDGTIVTKDGTRFLKKGSVEIAIPSAIAAAMNNRSIGAELTVGIRPSDLLVSFEKREGDGFLSFTVDFYQINGEKVVISAVKEDVKLVVVQRLDRENMIETGDPVWLKWDTLNSYLFDRDKGKNLIYS